MSADLQRTVRQAEFVRDKWPSMALIVISGEPGDGYTTTPPGAFFAPNLSLARFLSVRSGLLWPQAYVGRKESKRDSVSPGQGWSLLPIDRNQAPHPQPAIVRLMDVRFDVLKIDNIWTLTRSGPERRRFASQSAAITAAIAEACQHHEQDGGHATVHLWEGRKETIVFETVNDTA